jgi:hypothetical protein
LVDAEAADADHAWSETVVKGDKSAADKLTDTEFTWTDRTGNTHTKAEALAGSGAASSDTDAGRRSTA